MTISTVDINTHRLSSNSVTSAHSVTSFPTTDQSTLLDQKTIMTNITALKPINFARFSKRASNSHTFISNENSPTINEFPLEEDNFQAPSYIVPTHVKDIVMEDEDADYGDNRQSQNEQIFDPPYQREYEASVSTSNQNSESLSDLHDQLNFDELENGNILNFYDLVAKDTHGEPFPFNQLKGKLVLVCNIATQCTSSHQLPMLETLYQDFKHEDFVILGFPSNQFFQERTKGSDEDIALKCNKKFNVTFPIMGKVSVNGKRQDQVFKYLKKHKRGFLGSRRVKWNHEKFLINRDGEVISRYSTLQKPHHVERDLKAYLEEEEAERQSNKKIALIETRVERIPVSAQIQKIIYI